jgi:hypothetical protein
MSRSSSPRPNECCTNPANPWIQDSSGNYPRGGCNCNCPCAGKKGALGIRYRSASPPRNIPIAEEIAYLDGRAIAFSNSSGSVKKALDAAIISPSSYTGYVNSIFSQNAASAANLNNLQNTLVPQAASVAAASTAVAATRASRLAYNSMSEATYALKNINNVNNKDLAALVAKAKLAADALVPASNATNVAALAVYNTASSITLTANTAVTNASAALVQVECTAATAACNAVPGSTQEKVTDHTNMIAITTAKRKLELLKSDATKALSAENAANAVAITTTNAYISALDAQLRAVEANSIFLNIASLEQVAINAKTTYEGSPNNQAFINALKLANNNLAAAEALLPPIDKLNDLVVATSEALSLANTAAANARTLSASLDIQARNATVPVYNPVTAQMIAKQTAAAERFGASAAAAAARLARQSAAPPTPPYIPPARSAVYSVRVPQRSDSDNRKASEARALNAFKNMAQNPRFYNPY